MPPRSSRARRESVCARQSPSCRSPTGGPSIGVGCPRRRNVYVHNPSPPEVRRGPACRAPAPAQSYRAAREASMLWGTGRQPGARPGRPSGRSAVRLAGRRVNVHNLRSGAVAARGAAAGARAAGTPDRAAGTPDTSTDRRTTMCRMLPGAGCDRHICPVAASDVSQAPRSGAGAESERPGSTGRGRRGRRGVRCAGAGSGTPWSTAAAPRASRASRGVECVQGRPGRPGASQGRPGASRGARRRPIACSVAVRRRRHRLPPCCVRRLRLPECGRSQDSIRGRNARFLLPAAGLPSRPVNVHNVFGNHGSHD